MNLGGYLFFGLAYVVHEHCIGMAIQKLRYSS